MYGCSVITLIFIIDVSVHTVAEFRHGFALTHLLRDNLAILIPLILLVLRFWVFELDYGSHAWDLVFSLKNCWSLIGILALLIYDVSI